MTSSAAFSEGGQVPEGHMDLGGALGSGRQQPAAGTPGSAYIGTSQEGTQGWGALHCRLARAAPCLLSTVLPWVPACQRWLVPGETFLATLGQHPLPRSTDFP